MKKSTWHTHDVSGIFFAKLEPAIFRPGIHPDEDGRRCEDRLRESEAERFIDMFWLSETPVTQRQWKRLMGESNRPWETDGDELPVTGATLEEINYFLDLLNLEPKTKTLGLHYRLPTESEWEYACRAGRSELRPGGVVALASHWVEGLPRPEFPAPVKRVKANSWGLYDMIGCVWELCQPEAGCPLAARGGSYLSPEGDCRSGARWEIDCERSQLVGFRVAQSMRIDAFNPVAVPGFAERFAAWSKENL